MLAADGTLIGFATLQYFLHSRIVEMNSTEKSIEFSTWIEGKSVKTNSRAHSIVTLLL